MAAAESLGLGRSHLLGQQQQPHRSFCSGTRMRAASMLSRTGTQGHQSSRESPLGVHLTP